MTDKPFADAGDLEIDVRRISGTWYAHLPRTSLWAKGSSLDEAVARLQERQTDYAGFLAATGTAPLDLLDARPLPPTSKSRFARAAGLIAIIALCAIPISYALSTGIERGVEAAARQFPIRGLLPRLEASIIEFSKPEHDLPPERARALSEAIARIVERLSPYTATATGLFEHPGERHKPARPGASD